MFSYLHGRKEDEAKLITLPTFLWKRENVLDGMTDAWVTKRYQKLEKFSRRVKNSEALQILVSSAALPAAEDTRAQV